MISEATADKQARLRKLRERHRQSGQLADRQTGSQKDLVAYIQSENVQSLMAQWKSRLSQAKGVRSERLRNFLDRLDKNPESIQTLPPRMKTQIVRFIERQLQREGLATEGSEKGLAAKQAIQRVAALEDRVKYLFDLIEQLVFQIHRIQKDHNMTPFDLLPTPTEPDSGGDQDDSVRDGGSNTKWSDDFF